MSRIEIVGSEILVDTDRVHPFEGQPRRFFKKSSIEELALSIKRGGQRQPASLRILRGEGEETEYEIIDGERRWRACKLINRKLRAVIEAPADRREQFLHSAVANFQREPNTPLEVAYALEKIRKDFDLTQAELGDRFGKSPGWAGQYLSLLRLHPRVRELMSAERPEDQQLKFSAAIMLITFPEEEQIVMAELITKNEWKLPRAKHEIEKRAIALGLARVKGGRRERRPSDDFQILVRFIRRLGEDSEMLLQMDGKRFLQMFAQRSDIERVSMLKRAKECKEALGIIVQFIESSTGNQKLASR
jgi:ParB family chromosome partitioning protein